MQTAAFTDRIGLTDGEIQNDVHGVPDGKTVKGDADVGKFVSLGIETDFRVTWKSSTHKAPPGKHGTHEVEQLTVEWIGH
jgi:hypothetical protein